MELKQREVAKKTWICKLMTGTYHKSEGWSPSYVEQTGVRYSRVSMVATAVAKFLSEDSNYGTLTLDDGTETIRLKTFGPDVQRIKDVTVGAVVRCIGKVRQYADEIYIAPETVFRLEDPNWILVHQLGLGKPADAPAPEETKPQVPERVAIDAAKEEGSSLQAKALSIIKELDAGTGADMSAVMRKLGLDEEEARNILAGLLSSGDIYEPKKGYLRVL